MKVNNNLSLPSSPSPCPSKHRHTSLHLHQQGRVDSLSPILQDPDELELPPPLHPLTVHNLREHTQQTNPGETPLAVMTNSGSGSQSTQGQSDLQRLTQYGWTQLPDSGAFPGDLERFVNEVVQKDRSDETPGAGKLHNLHAKAKATRSEAKSAELIAKWLMPREADDDQGGEEFISACGESSFNIVYVKHATKPDLDLARPKPDRADGYVSRTVMGGIIQSPFDEDEEMIIQRFTVPLLHDEALFAWLTAEFKSARGKGIYFGALQNARAGIAANNYMRDFLAQAGFVATELETAHFSLACDSNIVALHLHWVGSDNRYYMKQVYQAFLHSEDRYATRSESMVKMRRYLRNILDWATGDRLRMIKTAISAVKDRRADGEEAAKKRAQTQAQAGAPAKRNMQQSGSSNSSRSRSGRSSTIASSGISQGRDQGPPQSREPTRWLTRLNNDNGAGQGSGLESSC